MSKKLEEKQRRRLAEEARRAEQRREALRKNLVTISVAALVTILVVVAIIYTREQTGRGGAPIGVSAADADCTEPESTRSQGREHIDVGAQHAPYATDPPTSGPHYEVPASPGFFPDQLPPEQVVHNMEHGQIVLWYSPDASSQTIDQVEGLVDKEPSSTVAIPYPNVQPADGIVVTAWTASMTCTQISEAAINEFREQFQGKSPEPLTEPFEG